MNVIVIGAGNSGLATAGHLTKEGDTVVLWNRSRETIDELMDDRKITLHGAIEGEYEIALITDDLKQALSFFEPQVILVTTPANSHREVAELLAKHMQVSQILIVLNPGRTFGALDFYNVFRMHNRSTSLKVAETQTIVYTCRKTEPDAVHVISLKERIPISTLNPRENEEIIKMLPKCLQPYFVPARSMIQTSLGNVGMVLHCAPLLLNTGWTESTGGSYKYYYEGITPSIGRLIEKIDAERVEVSRQLGYEVETVLDWLRRTYRVEGSSVFQCIQAIEAYKTIDAPSSLRHRYILEDVPFGLVPLEAVGKALRLDMQYTTLVIDLANALLEEDFRESGRNLGSLLRPEGLESFTSMMMQ
ncbi:MAG TPA: NAD(P)-binding domain-containing protein [Firmicutes bacterium]|nr:NAD(P)-binding domain-containing protein [Bacillota bacterium]